MQTLPEYAVTNDVWQKACDLADRGRRKGIRLPEIDLLIAAERAASQARHRGVRQAF